MSDNANVFGTPNQNSPADSAMDYMQRAADACASGDAELGMHLYLAAYEKASAEPGTSTGLAVAGLREAWHLACDLKERSMAEYVFEKLEPFLNGAEVADCAERLQNLALDRLEEYGFSREELEDMAEMISQDFLGDGSVFKVESITIPSVSTRRAADVQDDFVEAEAYPADDVAEGFDPPGDLSAEIDAWEPAEATRSEDEPELQGEPLRDDASPDGVSPDDESVWEEGIRVAKADGFNPYDLHDTSSVGKSYHAATNDGTGSYVFTRDADRAAKSAREIDGPLPEEVMRADSVERQPAAKKAKPSEANADAEGEQQRGIEKRDATPPAKPAVADLPPVPDVPKVDRRVFNYRQLVGYDEAVSIMRDFGIGLQNDAGFQNFIGMMNARHGLDRAPALDTLLFRAPVIEDATRFVEATIGELGLPVVRMAMEEGMQGMPVLCVTTQGKHQPRMNRANNRFEGPAILVIEDLDAWVVPEAPEGMEGLSGFMMANISRGAREAMNLIRSAVEDPDVFVLATATLGGEVDPFFYELLEPLSLIEIGYPNEREREGIWTEIMRDHPSMRTVNRADLLRFSAGMPRYDIYMAAREALEEAYKMGLVQRAYVPVSPQNIFDKLASCQPIDSDEYRAIEEEVIRSFKDDLDHLEDLVGGSFE